MNRNEVVEAFSSSAIDQRAAVKELMAQGLSAPDAYCALGIIDKPSDIEGPAFSKQIENQALRIQALASHPLVLTELAKLDALDPTSKEAEAKRFITNFSDPSFLRQIGLDDADRRLSLRVFEKPFNLATQGQDIMLANNDSPIRPATTICGSVGYIACLTIGKGL